jgi:hypothetical protein
MSSHPLKTVKLKPNLEKTSSTAFIKPDGSLIVEFYDFSDAAQDMFGNDVAYQLILSPDSKTGMLDRLGFEVDLTQFRAHSDRASDPDWLLLEIIESRFQSYFEIAEWLENHLVPFEKKFDAWA